MPNIICLQDTHLTSNDGNLLKLISECECYINGYKTNARGVAVLFKNNFEYQIKHTEYDTTGNYMVLDFNTTNVSIRLINVYAPNVDCPRFFEKIRKLVDENEQDYILLCGDLNLILNPEVDSYNYVNINNPQSRLHLLETMQIYNLKDVYRILNPNLRRYTWRRKNPVKQARLDYFICPESLLELINDCKIHPGYRSDHSLLEINIQLNSFKRGRGLWKFNCSLLQNKDYIHTINETIDEVKLRYCSPVYNPHFVKQNCKFDLQFGIEYDLLLEMMLLKIRDITTKFSINLKKANMREETQIIKEIEKIETNPHAENYHESLEMKQNQLQTLRKTKMNGSMIRSKAIWLHSGEKPTKYFCSLEKKNFIDKTIKKLTLENGEIVFEQNAILHHVKQFYAGLFKSRDDQIDDIDLETLLEQTNIMKLSKQEASTLEGPLTVEELGIALKKMKNNKTPGIDGFPSEFFKVFLSKLKYLILNALNHSYEKGMLSVSLRQTIINCIPKGDKQRDKIKNWRPISLLSVLYKLASSAIAARMNTVLSKLISQDQTGFVKGRYIGETTRLIYDIMHYTEVKELDGLLMLIDFEKAFDSISWRFMYNTLRFFGFGSSFIHWIKLFNNNIKASVLQAGVKSDFISIERGCKQGDPIAAYLFILCGQVLNYLIKKNKKIKGISIEDIEIKITQFADDTTLILDGCQSSLQAALNTIEIFGSFSGLKINTNKTKLVWIGRKIHCREKLKVTNRLEWGITEFKLLGITFSVDLDEVPNLNYPSALDQCKKLLANWKKRNLTVFGRISVLKTFIVPQFNHIFSSIPSPADHFLKELSKMLYQFIWLGKPDKIKRLTITQDYIDGGLRMIDITAFMKALKLTWIKRLFTQYTSPWLILFQKTICSASSLVEFGTVWCKNLTHKITNQFWIEILSIWADFSDKDFIKTNADILSSPIWYNPKISSLSMYFSKWFKAGIKYVGDIVGTNGTIMSLGEIENKYNIKISNFLEYMSVKSLCHSFVKTNQKDNNFLYKQPTIPKMIALIFSKPGSKWYYTQMINHRCYLSVKNKWCDDLKLKLNENNWDEIFQTCFKTVTDNNLVWFQYKILHRILGTQRLLHQIGKSDSDSCLSCCMATETLVHLFCWCSKAQKIWNDLKDWIKEKTGIAIHFDSLNIIMGYLNRDNLFLPINTIILVTKYYIYSNSRKKIPFNILDLQRKIKETYNEQILVSRLNFSDLKFEKKWFSFKNLVK